jgi:hypothetical protein
LFTFVDLLYVIYWILLFGFQDFQFIQLVILEQLFSA